MLRVRADGTVLYAGADAESFMGYPTGQFVGNTSWLEVAHPDDRWKLSEALRCAVDEQRNATVTVRFLTTGQEMRLARIYVLTAPSSSLDEVEAVLFDVTEQAEVEAVLQQGQAFHRVFVEQSPMGILHLDAAGLVTFENHAFRQIVGEGVEDAWIGRCVADIPGLEVRLKALVEHMLEDGSQLHGVAAIYQHPGSPGPAHLIVHGAPIRDPEGEIVGGAMMIEDVTEQHRRDEELHLRNRYEKAEVALREAVLVDLNETVFVHEAAAILGETTQADRVHLLIHLGDEGHCATRSVWARDERDEPFSLYVDTGTYPALRVAVVHGQHLHLLAGDTAEDEQGLVELTEAREVIWIPFFDAGRLGGFVLFERLTTREEAGSDGWSSFEARMMERLVRFFEALWSWIQVGQRYRLTVASIEDCLFTFSFSGGGHRHYLFMTPQVDTLTGYDVEEVLAREGDVCSWIEALVHPEDRTLVGAHDEALRLGQEGRLTYRVLHRDGTPRWLSEHATPHRDAAGRVIVSGVLADVTAQKDAEALLLNAQEQAASASRLKSTFVATMSHELRTPLGAVNGFAELLADELAEWEAQTGQMLPPQVHEFTEAVRQNARRLLMLADDLFVLSNMEIGSLQLERTAVSVNPIVQRAVATAAAPLAEKNVELRIALDPSDPVAQCDAYRLEQILRNLLANAAKFTDAGHVAVATRCAEAQVVIEVADTGVGIGPEYLDKLFTPFLQEDHRLNRRYAGTGVGLALVKRLLDAMHGRIAVESEKGRGSTFRIFLPAVGPAAM